MKALAMQIVDSWVAIAIMLTVAGTRRCYSQAQRPELQPELKVFMIPDAKPVPDDRMGPHLAANEVAITEPHSIGVWIVAPPPVVRTVKITVVDHDGKLVERAEQAFVHQPNGQMYHGQFSVVPDHKKHKAGKWKVTCEVPGWTSAEAEYFVLPAGAAEEAAAEEAVEDFYRAGEQVLKAIAHYWVFTNDTYVTLVGSARGMTGGGSGALPDLSVVAESIKWGADPLGRFLAEKLPSEVRKGVQAADIKSGLAAQLKQDLAEALERIITSQPIWDYSRFQGFDIPEDTRMRAAGNPQGADMVRVNRALLHGAYGGGQIDGTAGNLLHVKYLATQRMERVAISKADELNGITFRGRVSMTFEVFRVLDVRTGKWQRWQDVRPREGDSRTTERVRNALGPMYPEAVRDWVLGAFDRGPGEAEGVAAWRELTAMDFRVEKRDKVWFVEAVHARGSNGATRTASYWELIPYATFVSGKQREDDLQKAELPSPDHLAALNELDPARIRDRRLGSSMRATPAQVTASMEATINALRGKTR